MENFVLVVHLILAVALVGIVLMQRSEGGALGMGGGGGGGGLGGFMSGRAAANLLTRATAVIAALFIGTSLVLAIMASSKKATTLPTTPAPVTGPAKPGTPANTLPPVPPAPTK